MKVLQYTEKEDYTYLSVRKLHVKTDVAMSITAKVLSEMDLPSSKIEVVFPLIQNEQKLIQTKYMVSVQNWVLILLNQVVWEKGGHQNAKNLESVKEQIARECAANKISIEGEDSYQNDLFLRSSFQKRPEKAKTPKPRKLEGEKEEKVRNMAVNQYAQHSITKISNVKPTLNKSKGFSVYFSKYNTLYLKRFREHESLGRRALVRDIKTYDTKPVDSFMKGAFQHCII